MRKEDEFQVRDTKNFKIYGQLEKREGEPKVYYRLVERRN